MDQQRLQALCDEVKELTHRVCNCEAGGSCECEPKVDKLQQELSDIRLRLDMLEEAEARNHPPAETPVAPAETPVAPVTGGV
jgi:hypothetical protein